MKFEHADFQRNVYFTPGDDALPESNWKAPALNTLPSWRDAKRVCVDVEVRDPDLKRLGPGVRRDPATNYVCGIAFAIEDGPEHYLPIAHHGGGNCPEGPEAVWQYVRDQLRDFKGHIVGAKLDYDTDWMEEKTQILKHPLMDVQVADPLIWELHDSYSLETLCGRYELPGKDEVVLRRAAAAYRIDPKKEMWKMHARFVGVYGQTDARRPLQVLRRQEKIIERDGLGQIWALEQQVTPVLVKMRRRGVRVDMKKIEMIENKCLGVERAYLDRVHAQTGIRLTPEDAWKSEAFGRVLKKAGYKVPKTETSVSAKGKITGGKDSVDKELLEKCGEVGHNLHVVREWNKLRTTFCKSIRTHAVRRGDEYRIHCTFNQMKSDDDSGDGDSKGVRFGRTSCTTPNLQQQPVRHDDYGPMWRSVFCADLGRRWACSDWSQQEPRIAVHYAELLKLEGAKDFADEYRRNPAMDIHQRFSDITNIVRKICKNYVNGRIYGMGDLKTCRHIKQPTIRKMIRGEMREVPGPEGQTMIDTFNKFAPWIKGLTKACSKQAELVGHVWTMLRRKCNFEKRPDGTYEDPHKAFSRVGQGGAADQMKATAVACDREGIELQLIVHDEFDFSFDDIRQAKLCKELQLNTVKYNVPMLVDLEVGPDWGTLEKIAS
jgi:Mesyanzhinovviridae DNA polymerase